jgi:transforming growth factor-beta-induced protein
LGPNILDYVLNPHNVKDLDTVLTYHVHAGKVLSTQITNGEQISTVDGVNVVAGVANGVVTIDGARVIAADNLATNGVAHIIDRVLIPSNLALPTSTVVDLAIATSSLSTLVTAVTTANLVNFFNTTAPMTVFAPTNDAFNNLPAGTLDYLLAHPAELAQVLYYHAIDRRRYSEEFVNFERLRTFDGREIIAIVENGVVSFNAAANVTIANIQGSNGVVHVIDAVLIPAGVMEKVNAWVANGYSDAAPMNIVQLAQSVPDLSTLVTAVVAGKLVDALSGSTILTVFAPTNQAFNLLPPQFLDTLLNNTALLDQVLTYHVVAGNISSTDLTNGEVAPTLNGANLTFTISPRGDRVFVNDAMVIKANNYASNGVVHIIDGVLLP